MNYEYDTQNPEERQNLIEIQNKKNVIRKKITVKPMYEGRQREASSGSQQSKGSDESFSQSKTKAKRKVRIDKMEKMECSIRNLRSNKTYDANQEKQKMKDFQEKFKDRSAKQSKIFFGGGAKEREKEEIEDFELYKLKNKEKVASKKASKKPASAKPPQASQQVASNTNFTLSQLALPDNILNQIQETE